MRKPFTVVLLALFAAASPADAQQCSGVDPNLPPVASNDAIRWPSGPVTIDVLANDHDPERMPLTLASVGNPAAPDGSAGGTAVKSGNAVSFTPAPSAKSATFTYVVTDGQLQATATVAVGGFGTSPLPPALGFDVACIGRDCDFRVATPSAFHEIRETRWEFGDGATSPAFFRAMNASHTYAATGTFTTKLTLVYFDGSTASATRPVTAGNLPSRIGFDFETTGPGVGGLRLRLVIRQVVLGSSANDVLGYTYGIDWGDGTPEEALAHFSGLTPLGARRLHVYASPGTYGVTVIARKSGAPPQPFQQFVTVANQAPVPRFFAAIGADQRTVTFDPSISDDDIHPGFSRTHEWDFGDGTARAGVVTEIAPGVKRLAPVSHTYTAAGHYDVRLSITDAQGATGVGSRKLLVGTPQPPSAAIQTQGCHGRICTFVALASDNGNVLEYTWDFGDGSPVVSSSDMVVGHEYAANGCHVVTLTVTDDELARTTVTLPIAVSGVLARAAGTVVVDAHGRSDTKSNLNGILEPGETAILELVGRNPDTAPRLMIGALDDEPVLLGGTGTLLVQDRESQYGLLDFGLNVPGLALADCWTGDEGNCYRVRLDAAVQRPASVHWDARLEESIDLGAGELLERSYRLHIGRTFNDVSVSSPFYPFIEALVHHGLTTGCGNGAYCPSAGVTREQIAVFLLAAHARTGSATAPEVPGAGHPENNPDNFDPDPSFTPAACAAAPFDDVPCSSPYAAWIAELKARGITSGCGNGNYCPGVALKRGELAYMLLRTLEPGLATPACTNVFSDLPCTGSPDSFLAPWAEELFRRGIARGCAAGQFCPGAPVTREQLAALLVRTFDLRVAPAVCAPGAIQQQ